MPSVKAMMWWRDDDLARRTDNRLVPVVEIWCWDGGCAGQIETIFLVSSSLFFYNRNVPEASKQRSGLQPPLALEDNPRLPFSLCTLISFHFDLAPHLISHFIPLLIFSFFLFLFLILFLFPFFTSYFFTSPFFHFSFYFSCYFLFCFPHYFRTMCFFG